MKRNLLAIALMALIPVFAAAQTVLAPEVIAKLSSCVFEVVTKKAEGDPLVYDRELPVERLSYAERTDKYDSIGTAFLMDDGYLYTASHVLQLEFKLHQDEFFIRDMEGEVYPIDTIVKFATDRDFVIFTAKNLSVEKGSGLHFNRSIAINTQVFAVGNAQGEGIIIRDGMFTSRTPETQDGRWKWLRFSAAASPGNSGGPLVDRDGNVVGIITMKNQTENLNYALPIAEIENSPDGKGIVNMEVYYRLANIESQRFYKKYEFEVQLPSPIGTVRQECWKNMQSVTKNHASALYAKYCFTGEGSFVQTDKNNSIFTANFLPSFPMFMCLSSNNKWGAYYTDTESFDLEDNGSVDYADFLGMQMAYIKKPDSVSEEELIKNPKLCMDYMLEASPMWRAVGTESVRIVSYGEPVSTSTHTDRLGRQWIVAQWDVPWADVSVLAYELPLPQGIFIMSVYDDVCDIENGWNTDIPYLTDFCIPPYYGTVRDWNEYLSLPKSVYPRHKFLADAKFSYSPDELVMKFGEIDIDIDPDLVYADDTDEDEFCLAYTYEREKKSGLKQTVSVIALSTNEGTNDYHYIQVLHVNQPPAGASKSTQDNYKKIKNRSMTFNGEPYTDGQITNCDIVYDITDSSLNVLGLEIQGANRIEEMTEFRDSILDALGIKQ